MSVCTVDKSKVKISQNFVASSEYTNFTIGNDEFVSEFLLNLLTFFKMFNTYFLDILKVQKYNEHDPGLKLIGLVYFFSKKPK